MRIGLSRAILVSALISTIVTGLPLAGLNRLFGEDSDARTSDNEPSQRLPGLVVKFAETETKDSTPSATALPDSMKEKTKPAAEAPVAGWNKEFFLQSADKSFFLRFTGQIQTDYRAFFDNGDTKDIDTFLMRRARLGIEATVFEFYEFRLLPDFGQGKAIVQDAYVNIHYVDSLQVQAGKFKEPVSYEQLIQDRFVPTMERSIFDQVVPQRDVGLMIHGQKLLDNHLDYALGVFNGEINGDTDTNKLRDAAARVAFRPFASEGCWEGVRGLQVGVSGTTGIEQEPINPNTLRTPATVPWLVFNSPVRANGLRNRWTPEVSYFWNSFGFAAQYFRMDQDMSPTATSKLVENVPFKGFYVLGTYLLTGEKRTTYSQAVEPLAPFDPHYPLAAPGAWELVARVSRLDLSDDIFTKGAGQLVDPSKYSSGATELTLGFNWYLNAWVRTQFNWEHAWFDQPVLLGAKTRFGDQDSLLTRLQIIF